MLVVNVRHSKDFSHLLLPHVVSQKTHDRKEQQNKVKNRIRPETGHDPSVGQGEIQERGDDGVKWEGDHSEDERPGYS